jgi:FMN-dependent NADH-azoreductase
VSRQLTADIVTELKRAMPNLAIHYHDLAAQPLPHWAPVADASDPAALLGNEVMDEFLAADVIVLGAPMYNFGIPSQLKAWIDRIAVPGRTFRYTENGPEGLAGGKKVIIASARGGLYSAGNAGAAADFQEPYLRTVLGFLGVTDIEFVRAEGVALSPEHRNASVKQALQSIATPVAEAA